MQYSIKITAKSGKETSIDCIAIEALGNAFKGLNIMSDTPTQNVKDRATNILVRLQLDMLINKDTCGICKDLMEWSLSSKGEDVHRTVEIKVTDNETTLRTFKIPKMFVEDYEEKFINDADIDEARFCLKLIQLAGETSNIEQLSE